MSTDDDDPNLLKKAPSKLAVLRARSRAVRVLYAIAVWMFFAAFAEGLVAVVSSRTFDLSQWPKLFEAWLSTPNASVFAIGLLVAAFVESLRANTPEDLRWSKAAVLVQGAGLVVICGSAQNVIAGTATPYLPWSIVTVVACVLFASPTTIAGEWRR